MYYNLKLKVKKMKKQTKEVFKDIPNYEGMYQASNLGRVKSLKFNRERILKTLDNGKGYLFVGLSCEGKQKQKSVHQIMAITFLNHTPDGYNGLIVDHKDNDKSLYPFKSICCVIWLFKPVSVTLPCFVFISCLKGFKLPKLSQGFSITKVSVNLSTSLIVLVLYIVSTLTRS
jgi:hypothetical protein